MGGGGREAEGEKERRKAASAPRKQTRPPEGSINPTMKANELHSLGATINVLDIILLHFSVY